MDRKSTGIQWILDSGGAVVYSQIRRVGEISAKKECRYKVHTRYQTIFCYTNLARETI